MSRLSVLSFLFLPCMGAMLAFVILAGSPAYGAPPPLDVDLVSADLKQLINLQVEGNNASDGFDPNACFAIFRHLTLEKGMRLEYVPNDWNGLPWVYARLDNAPPIKSLAEAQAAHPEPETLGEMGRFAPAFIEQVRTDGTPEGYLQLALLALQGRQFRLKGHANLLNLTILLDQTALERIISQKWLRPENVEKSRQVDLTPTVTETPDGVTVRYVVFANDGITEIRWTVTKTFPHRVLRVEWRLAVADAPTMHY